MLTVLLYAFGTVAAAALTAEGDAFDPTPPGIRVMDELRAKGIYSDEVLSFLEGEPLVAHVDVDEAKLGLYGREVDGRKRA